MKYLIILKTALKLFFHCLDHLSKENIKKNDIIQVDISWTIKRIKNEET